MQEPLGPKCFPFGFFLLLSFWAVTPRAAAGRIGKGRKESPSVAPEPAATKVLWDCGIVEIWGCGIGAGVMPPDGDTWVVEGAGPIPTSYDRWRGGDQGQLEVQSWVSNPGYCTRGGEGGQPKTQGKKSAKWRFPKGWGLHTGGDFSGAARGATTSTYNSEILENGSLTQRHCCQHHPLLQVTQGEHLLLRRVHLEHPDFYLLPKWPPKRANALTTKIE